MSEKQFNSLGKLIYKIAYKEAKARIHWFEFYGFVSVEDLVQISVIGTLSMDADKKASSYASRIRCRIIDYYRFLDSHKRNEKDFKSIITISELDSSSKILQRYCLAT